VRKRSAEEVTLGELLERAMPELEAWPESRRGKARDWWGEAKEEGERRGLRSGTEAECLKRLRASEEGEGFTE
jgi:hypothetical protein